MAYTEKVCVSGSALSFLLYECVNSSNSQEGFLIGDATTELTSHISDSHSDNARLDTEIVVRTVLPLPSISLFYLPTGRIKEDVLREFLNNMASEVVGWYKYRKNSGIKPTFRDKLISKGLQKYFEKHHGKKHFVTCHLSNKVSAAGSTHTYTYRFGKINCFDMYEYIQDVTANLGEKLTGYKKPQKLSHSVFNKIVKDINVQINNSSNAIICIHEAVDVRLRKEAVIAAKNESTIRELEAEIKQMTAMLSDKQVVDLEAAYVKMQEDKYSNRGQEIVEACIQALKTPTSVDILKGPNDLLNSRNVPRAENSIRVIDRPILVRSPSPVLPSSSAKPVINYASVLKNKPEVASSSKFNDDLINFDVEEKNNKKSIIINDDIKILGDSSPEY